MSFGPPTAWAELEPGAGAQWVVWDLTDTVAEWLSGGLANDGILLKLVDEQESYDVGGPAMPSSRFAEAELRPRLVVSYVT